MPKKKTRHWPTASRRRKKWRARKGFFARSIYDGRAFGIDASVLPNRLFHEKGTDRWWLGAQLRSILAPAEQVLRVSAKKKETLAGMHRLALQGAAGKLAAALPKPELEVRACLECGHVYTPARKHQKFCQKNDPPCARVYNKRLADLKKAGLVYDAEYIDASGRAAERPSLGDA